MAIDRSQQNWPDDVTLTIAEQLERDDKAWRERLSDEDELEYLMRTR